MKRLFRVAELNPIPEFIGPWGTFEDQGQAFLFEDQSFHVLVPSRLCAQAQSGDDMPFHKQACMEYTRWVFYKLFERPKERHLACPTRMHGFRPLLFQGYILNYGLIPLPDHLFGGDTGFPLHFISLLSFLITKEFGDSYKAPSEEIGKGPASESSAKKKGRIVGNKMLQGIPTASYGDPPASTFCHC
nr:hypothetical protein [Tanacetum cinerariifolium]